MKTPVWAFVLILCGAAVSCRPAPDRTAAPVLPARPKAAETQTAQQASPRLVPEHAVRSSKVRIESPAAFPQGSVVEWHLNGMKFTSAGSSREFPSGILKRDDVLQAYIVKDGERIATNRIIVRNSPPAVTRAVIMPDNPSALSRVSVHVTAEDDDSDIIFFRYAWIVNGKRAGEGPELHEPLKRGDRITVEVYPADGKDSGLPVTLKTVAVNAPPVVKDGVDEFDGAVYRYRMNAVDPDGDTLAYSLGRGPSGMKLDAVTGVAAWEFGDAAGEYPLEAAVTDGHGGKTVFGWRVRVGRK